MTMILRYSPTSPYVRKISVAIKELGLSGQIEHIATDPWNPETDLAAQNPLGKVPTLITRSGQVLFDSHVICEYLDGLHCGPRLFPSEPKARIQALQLVYRVRVTERVLMVLEDSPIVCLDLAVASRSDALAGRLQLARDRKQLQAVLAAV